MARDGRGPRCPASLLPTPARQPGVLPRNQATLHLLSGVMSTPFNWLLLAQANFYSLDYPFSFPLFSANGLTMCLPVTSPPLLASREESLNRSSLKGWACAGRNVGWCLGHGLPLLASTAAWPQMLQYFMGVPPLVWPIQGRVLCLFVPHLNPVPGCPCACDRWPGCLRWAGGCRFSTQPSFPVTSEREGRGRQWQ